MADLILWKDRELKQLKSEMDRMVKDFFRDFGTAIFDEVHGETVLVDITEKADSVIITARLPTGIGADDLEVAASPESLIIGGSRKESLQGENARLERSSSFSNRIRLPCRVEPDKVEASYENNVLKIVLPRCRATIFKKIDIRQTRNNPAKESL